jgi:four helix bundle protein
MYRTFEDLEVWKRASNLSVELYNVLKDTEEFGLRDQMMKAVVSVASNIAEGFESDSPRELIQMLMVARGSMADLRTQLHIAEKAGVIPITTAQKMITESKEVSAMITSLVRAKKRQFPGN